MTTPNRRFPALMIQSTALSAVMTLALLLSWAALPTRAGAEAKPGDIITRHNAEKVKGMVAEGVYWAVLNGMELEIVPYKHIPLPSAYEAATEKYS